MDFEWILNGFWFTFGIIFRALYPMSFQERSESDFGWILMDFGKILGDFWHHFSSSISDGFSSAIRERFWNGFWFKKRPRSSFPIFPGASCKPSWCLLALKMASRGPQRPPRRPQRPPRRPQRLPRRPHGINFQ